MNRTTIIRGFGGRSVPEGPDLRVLQIGMSWFPEQAGNGLDRVFHALTQNLPDVGVSVTGVVAGSARVARDTGGHVRAFAEESAPLLRRMVAARRAIRNELRANRPDLVASHFAMHTAPAIDLLSDLPLVVHFHGPWAAESKMEGGTGRSVRVKAWIERRVYRRAHQFIVLSDAFKKVLSESYHVDESQIRIVPGGVDTDCFAIPFTQMEARERLGWPVDRPIVLSVRRLARRMGLERLIEAVGRVRHEVQDVLVLVVGKGQLRSELEARIRDSGLSRHVRLLGFLPEGDLPLAYRAADISIVPSTALEGFGLTTVESLAAGTPVLVTPSGGLPEVVRDLADELVCDGMHSSDLAARLIPALRGDLRLPSAEACRAYARARYDWSIVAEKTRAVYDEVCA